VTQVKMIKELNRILNFDTDWQYDLLLAQKVPQSTGVATNARGTTVGKDRFHPFRETRFSTGMIFMDKLCNGAAQGYGLGHLSL
jgi:hypothetical protein